MLASLHLLPAPRVPAHWLLLAKHVQTYGPDAVHQQLGKAVFHVPDIEHASGQQCMLCLIQALTEARSILAQFRAQCTLVECRCSLAAQPTAKRFLYPQLNKFLADLFASIPYAVGLSRLPKVTGIICCNKSAC